MAEITIRQIHDQEIVDIFHWFPSYAFRSTPPLPDKAEEAEKIKGRGGVRYFALFEESAPMACGAITPLTQNVRGRLFPCYGVFDIVTHPAARRKGYARRLMIRLLEAIHEDDRPLSTLYPFRESFYERLGYISFPFQRTVRFSPTDLLPLLKQDLGGTVELKMIGEGIPEYIGFMRSLRAEVHGLELFDYPNISGLQQNRNWLALAKVDGEVVGLMVYQLKENRSPSILPARFLMSVLRFYYLTSQGRYLLLEWLARHADQANQIELLSLPPYEFPETWVADLKLTPDLFFLAPMGRVVDVAGIAGMSTGPGKFTARIRDPYCPWNEGSWTFETEDGKLAVRQAPLAENELSIQGLSALIYGSHAPADFAYRGWGRPSAELQATLQIMFPPKIPYLHEYF